LYCGLQMKEWMIIAANFPTSHYFTPYGKIWT